MVRWVKDLTGKFPQRPHYEVFELDAECEQLITSFLRARHGAVKYPIDTGDLTVLLERETEVFDMYADLSGEGDGIQGVTEFRLSGKPSVRISKDLSAEDYRRNRLRTTLTHELGHVKFHGFLWAFSPAKLTGRALRQASPRCHRNSIVSANETDWMEWQAGYASVALLMPRSALKAIVVDYRRADTALTPIFAGTEEGRALMEIVQDHFGVSSDAARLRLLKLGYIADGDRVPSMFDTAWRP